MAPAGDGYSFWIQGSVLVLAVLSLLLAWWSARHGSPVVAIFGRWLRWLFVALLAGSVVHDFGWTGYSLPVLVAVAAMGWFLIETAYNWVAISALSRSELPLFPDFQENEHGDDWPSSARFIRLKDWLRDKGFQKKQALVSELDDQVIMRVSVFENADQTIRLHLLLLPNARGHTVMCMTFFSATRAGEYIVTDNIFLPFGGFYPENWDIERNPWTRSPERLLHRHQARIDAKAQALLPFVTGALEQIHEDQRQVEQLNRDLGFLRQRAEEGEHGRLTHAGKARLWQEVWTLAYLGLPLRYN